MIRKNPAKDMVNPPGQLINRFEKPLAGLIEDYQTEKAQEGHQNALQASYDRGLRAGYLEGYERARMRFVGQGPLDPFSEADR
jgi:flagellar biosynthesis/type III secretory pathway protein FliH